MSIPVTETAAAAPSPAPAPAPAPLFARIADTFFAPGRAFEQLRDGPAPWVGPVLVAIVVSALLPLAQLLVFTPHELAEFAVQQAQSMGAASSGDLIDRIEPHIVRQMAIGAAFSVPGVFIVVAVLGLILAAVWGLLLGGRTQLRPYVAVAAHAMLVGTLGAVVATAFSVASHQLGLKLSLGLLLGDDGGVLKRILDAVTPFGVWMAILLAYGGAVVNRRRGWAGAFAILYGTYLALVAAWAMVAQMLASRAH